MKKKAEFTDKELKVLETALDLAIFSADEYGVDLREHKELVELRKKMWAQRHGTCAADVD